MSIQSLKQNQRWLVPAALLLTLAGLFVARTAFAKIASNTIDPVGIVADHGRTIIVSGPVGATAGEVGDQEVTVTQRETGAVAKGRTLIRFTGEIQQWEVHAAVQGAATFQPGPATAVAFCRSTIQGQATDAHQWLVNITLVQE